MGKLKIIISAVIVCCLFVPALAMSDNKVDNMLKVHPTHITFTKVIKEQEEAKRIAKEKRLKKERIAHAKKAEEERLKSRRLVYSVYAKSNLSEAEFNKILSNTALAGCGDAYYNLEQTYGVNGIYAIAVSGTESGFGAHQCNTNNIYGMRNGSTGWMAFGSKYECINYFGQLMSKPLYKGKSLSTISTIYCEQSSDWYNMVTNMMNSLWVKL